MIEPIKIGDATLYHADVIEGLRSLPAESVQCVVTSPPYWGLRDYAVEGMIGLEPTFQEWLDRMVAVCEEIKRVLRSDGTFWLNCGDAYAGSGKGQNADGSHNEKAGDKQNTNQGTLSGGLPTEYAGFKPKDLLMMPARLAIALQAAGWWLRSEIIWAKPNPMPESVTDRPTSSHEKIYLLTKSSKYFYDADAVREAHEDKMGIDRFNSSGGSSEKFELGINQGFHGVGFKMNSGGREYNPAGRNLRNVWAIATQPYPEAHFATFPEALPMKCIMAGTSERGCCPECGMPWVRVVEKSRTFESGSGKSGNLPSGKNGPELQGGGETLDIRRGPCVSVNTLGWRPSCECNINPNRDRSEGYIKYRLRQKKYDPVPCTVLDPFSGSATTGLVALKLNRRYIGIELNPEYVELSRRRIQKEADQMKLPLDNC